MEYLIDTNVASELRKAGATHPHFIKWSTRVDQSTMFLSVLVVGEICRGIENVRRKNPAQARALDVWRSGIVSAFNGRIVPIAQDIAETWLRLTLR